MRKNEEDIAGAWKAEILREMKKAVIAIDADRISDLEQMRESLRVILARASCRNISREEVHALIDEIYEEYGGL